MLVRSARDDLYLILRRWREWQKEPFWVVRLLVMCPNSRKCGRLFEVLCI
jgi:hypothetical protein